MTPAQPAPSGVRRIATAFLAVGLALAASSALTVLWLRVTLLDADCVLGLLEEAGTYEYVSETGMPSWIDYKLTEFGVDDPAQRQFAVLVFHQVAPEQAQRERVEEIIGALIPYVAGERAELSIRPRLAELVLDIPRALASLEFPSWVVDAVLAPKLAPAVEALAGEPLRVPVTADQARSLAREIAPARWVDAQVVGATYAVARWAIGEQRTFAIQIDYAQRVDQATTAFKRLLRRSNVEEVVVDRVIVPAAVNGLSQLAPFSDSETDPDEVCQAIQRIAPNGWLHSQVDGAIDALGDYLAGRREGFSYSIDTGSLRGTAADVVGQLARETLGDEVTDEQLKELSRSVRVYFPETTTWSDQELAAALGPEPYQQLRTLRGFITQGFTYDQEDLRRDLVEQLGMSEEQIDLLRHVLSEAYVYTEIDLQDGRLGMDLEQTMLSLRRASPWRWAVFGLTLLLLVGLTLTAGPGWDRRVRTVLAALAMSGLLAWLAIAPWIASELAGQVLHWVPGSAESARAAAFAGRMSAAIDGTVDQLRWWGLACALGMGLPAAVLWLWRWRSARVGDANDARSA